MAIIADYAKADNDVVYLYKNGLADVEVSVEGNNVVMDFSDNDGVIIENGIEKTLAVKDQVGDIRDLYVAGEETKVITYVADMDVYYGNEKAGLVVADSSDANIWLDSTDAAKNGGADYRNINNINAKDAKGNTQLHGNEQDNIIMGGSGNDEIWAGKSGTNTVYGGGGADTFYLTADGGTTIVRDGSAMDNVMLYNCGITDISTVEATLVDNKLTINVGDSAMTIENWSAAGLNTFKVAENSTVSQTMYTFDKETSKLVAKA